MKAIVQILKGYKLMNRVAVTVEIALVVFTVKAVQDFSAWCILRVSKLWFFEEIEVWEGGSASRSLTSLVSSAMELKLDISIVYRES